MKRRTAIALGLISLAMMAGCIALLAAAPGTDWAAFESADTIRSKATPEEVYPGLSKITDRTSTVRPGRNVVFEVSCPDGPAAMDCAAGAGRAVAIWMARHGGAWPGPSRESGEVTWLLINVTTPKSGFSGPQLIGDVHPIAELDSATTGFILDRFNWNGSGDLGEVSAAQWCARQSQHGAFCKTFQAEACQGALLKEPEVKRFCARDPETVA